MAKIKDLSKDPLSEASKVSELAKDEVEITSPDQLTEIQDKNKLAGFSGWFFTKNVKNVADEGTHEIRVPSVNDKGEHVFVKGAKAICKVIPVVLLAIGLLLGNAYADGCLTTDEACEGNQRWRTTSSGHFVPGADSSYTIGASGTEVSNIYTDSLVVNGTTYTSFAAGTDGNWTGTGTNVTLDGAPTKFIATFSSGDFFATGFTVDTGDITFGQGGKIDGDTNGTMKLIEASDTLSFIFSGTTIQLDSSDGGFEFALSDSTEGTLSVKARGDTDDYMTFTTVSDVPTIITAGTSNLVIAPDGGGTSVTGTLAVSGVTTTAGLTTSSTITLQNTETIVNSTDGTVQIGGGTSTILSVLDTGTGETDATLLLRNDNSTDNGDDWQIVSDGATDDLFFQNDTSGSQATIFTIADSGLVTTTADVVVAGTTPLVTIGDGGDEDAGIQLNSDTSDWYIASENTLDAVQIGLGSSIGTTPIYTGLAASTTITGSTDGKLIVYGAGTSNSDAYLQLIGDAAADAADGWQFFNDSSAGDLLIGNDSGVSGTYVTKLHLDSTGVAVLHGTTDGALDIYADGTTASDAYLRLIGDAQTDASDSFQVRYDSSDAKVYFEIDDTTPGTYITKSSLSSTGAFNVQGSEGAAGSVGIWADNGDDAIDKVELSVADGGALTMTTGAVTGFTVSAAGLFNTVESATFGSAITDVNTFTGKIAGASPMSFDGTTADTVYTIFAITDPTSASKTITFPATTGAVVLSSLTTNTLDAANAITFASNAMILEGATADDFETTLAPTDVGADATITLPTKTGTLHGSGAVVALTPGATPTLTVVAGRQVFTYQPADNTDATFNASAGGSAGDSMTFIFTTDAAGSGDEVMTFGTNMYSTGTLTMANLAADIYVVSFVSNGTAWVETGRTAVQTT